ncbi:NUDIX hydrolase [Saccharomonospora xinjiangensis]|uniref:ADP-ribose pyrophosphatase n=1 Tax=Saccharomonospora xinjiangensis XJ-54 TaxID=882086 RepID=I0V0D2_9PSEU|nr:NUDIX domain-containing protein [Saccharomonospora xinjiangensis]EID53585.1 ADP-ribose pyrophosphatase [Saccharomonospora xinjiangensis XJ-54]
MDTQRCVGGVVFDAEGRLLLIRRRQEPSAGLWSLPGGRVERGESDPEAVIRELREETGLTVRPISCVGLVTRGRYEIHDYTCTVEGGRLRPGDDADDARWVTSAELAELDEAGLLTAGLTEALTTWNALPRR